MDGLIRRSPGLARALVLAVVTGIVVSGAHYWGEPLDWGIAILYGIAIASSMRWPITMGGTGVRVVITTGLRFEALWHHGLATAVMLMVVEYGARLFVINQGRSYWEWFRPVLTLFSFFMAYGLQVLVQGSAVLNGHAGALSHLDTPALIMVYAYWALLNSYWTLAKPKPGRTGAYEFFRCMQQTWWAPLLFVLAAGGMTLVHGVGLPLTAVVCILLVWLQAQIGPVFTTLNQDTAVARLVHTSPAQNAAQRSTVHRVLRTAHMLGRSLGLSAQEMRVLGYAALLQDLPADAPEVPLWLSAAPTPAQGEAIRTRLAATRLLIETDGALQEVAQVIAYRYASYDGEGYPAIAGEAIPLLSQVLAAANALVCVPQKDAEGWLRQHAATRFSRTVLAAMSQAFMKLEPVVDRSRGLPEAVRQLQGLVSESAAPSPMWTALRRFWGSLRGQTGLAPDLPAEVQAVARLATYFASSTRADDTAQITAEAVGQLIGAKVAVALREGTDTELNLHVRAAYGFTVFNPVGVMLDLYGGPLSRAMLEQAPYQVADLREVNSPVAEEAALAEGCRSALFVPLVHRNRTTGMIFIALSRYHWFTPREVGLIHLMAGQAAAALENARLIAEAEERLEHISNMAAFTDSLLDNLSTSILVVDPEGLLVMANAVARQRFGAELLLEIKQPLPEPLAAVACMERALAGEVTPEEDVHWGSTTLEVQTVPLKDGRGVVVGAIWLARDVTQVRSMEQQVRRVEKLAAIGELAAGAAHEIRNPLTSIRGFMQLLQARASRADGDYFQIILNEIDRIDGIIRDMLLLARPAEVRRVETHLPTLLAEVLFMHQTELEAQNITVVKEFSPAAETTAIDPKMFRQLLLNLVINAMQAMPYGGTLRLALRPEGTESMVLEVGDTGVGIPPDNLKRLFVPFFTTKEEGTGLGLALCYSIVQAHGGRIDVTSQLGLGTTFTIKWPRK